MKTLNTLFATSFLTITLTGLFPGISRAGFSLPSGSTSPGHGLSNVLSGTLSNGALFWQSTTNWVGSTPAKPYAVTNDYALPPCDSIAVARLVATIWGGTPHYVSQLTVTVNGANLPSANPLVFGTTNDANPVFSATSANAYGSGSGVWLITLPVPGSMLNTNGSINTIVVSQDTANGFDGRVQHVTLLAVYESGKLANTFDYAIAEGSGDIYKTPAGAQVSQRTVTFAPVNPSAATAASLDVLYTYADSLNDRLYFNSTQLGGDNVAQWDTSVANNGPSVLSFDVLNYVSSNNAVTFSLASDVPATPETSLRPQLAALAVTRPPAISAPTLTITSAGQLSWPTNAAGFALETASNLATGAWTAATNTPVVSGDQYRVTLDLSTAAQQFYRLKKSN